MDKGYVRLKLKILLMVAGLTAVGGVLCALLLGLAMRGELNSPLGRLALWCGQNLFGASRQSAADFYLTHIQGKRLWLINAGTVLFLLLSTYWSMGRFTKWLGEIGRVTRQVVEQRAQEISLPRELLPVQQDLSEIQRILARREEETRESERRRTDLVAYLAHDLKTPLTSVVGYLTLLQDKPELDLAQRMKYTGIALDKARRLEELIGEFFDIARMELEQGRREPVQLSILLEQLTDEFSLAFSEKGLTCSPCIEPRLAVLGDPEQLARVFDNVLRNAVSYSAPGAQVEVEARRDGDAVEIAVRNEGLLIPEQELVNIFNKFYRLDTARSTRTGGAGLGLAIAREIIGLHGGSIRAESDGRRTSFILRLPALSEKVRP